MLAASLLVAVLMVVSASGAQGASTVAVCGSGFGHGVGLSQYGAKGRAEAGQGHAQIVRAYYSGATLATFADNPRVRVLLAEKGTGESHDVTVRAGRTGQLENLATGGTLALPAGIYRTQYLASVGLYRVTNISTGTALGSFRGPVLFRPVRGGPLGVGASDYRGTITPRVVGARFYLVNRLGMEGYLRGVVPREMPSSWAPAALRSQAIAARSYARATQRTGAFDFYADVRDQVYGGASAETFVTNAAVANTARVHAIHNGATVRALFHSSDGGHTEDAGRVFDFSAPYLTGFRDVDGLGRSFEGTAHANSPWRRWSGTLDSNGSPQFGVGAIQGIRVLERTPSGRVSAIEVRGSTGTRLVSGQQNIRFGLQSTGVLRADGSTRPGGALPSARISFGAACA